MASDPKLAPETSNENFHVFIENRTDSVLNPLEGGFHFDSGRYGSGGKPVSIVPYTSGAVPQAFFVEGKIGAFGVQGFQRYVVSSGVQGTFQFNSVYKNRIGTYFYPGLQPRTGVDDATFFYLQLLDIPIPIPVDQKSFSPQVVVWPNKEPYHVNPLAPPSKKNVDFALKIVNRTKEIMTLNEVKKPLYEYFQPLFAPTVLCDDGRGDVYLATFETDILNASGQFIPIPVSEVVVVYNLGGGAQLTISYKGRDTPAVGTFSGTNTERYRFTSTVARVEDHLPHSYRVELTVTIDVP